jgi:hypothetical protein
VAWVPLVVKGRWVVGSSTDGVIISSSWRNPNTPQPTNTDTVSLQGVEGGGG